MRQFIFDYYEQYFDEIEPLEFYRRIFPSGQLAQDDNTPAAWSLYAYHGTIIDKNIDAEHRRHRKVFDDLEEIKNVIRERRDAVLAPVLYCGMRRTDKNARYINAITLDLDGIETQENLLSLQTQIDNDMIPCPTFTVCSGNGLHLYYLLDKPVPCYRRNLALLKRYKAALTRLIWNRYVTKEYEHPQYEAVTQAMRLVGSVTKDGGTVKAYETGEPCSLGYLESFMNEHFLETMYEKGMLSLEYAKELYPDWYERRIVQRLPRGRWFCNRGLYDNWLLRIRNEKMLGHRYFCIMVLAIFAIKCGVPFEELEKDAYSLIPIFDAITEGTNAFTEYDVKCALRCYAEEYVTFPKRSIERITGLSFPIRRRNGIKQKEHLEGTRALKAIRKRNGTMHPEGRPSKEGLVLLWMHDHPEGSKSECKKDTGLSYPTIRKYWKENREQEKAAMPFEKYASYSEIMQDLANKTEEEQARFYAENEQAINKLIARIEENIKNEGR